MKEYKPSDRKWLAEHAEKLLRTKRAKTVVGAIAQTFAQYPKWKTPEYQSTILGDILEIQERRATLLVKAKEKHIEKERGLLRAKKRKHRIQKVKKAIKRLKRVPSAVLKKVTPERKPTLKPEPEHEPSFKIDDRMRREAELLSRGDPKD
jgi:hypothetical protein